MYYSERVNMKVFVSWSGELSKKLSEFLKTWLEQCIQSVEVFFSPEDIEKGENWQLKLSNELRETNFGIVCVTSENVDAPWLHFEAGALSKLLDSKVMVLAVNVNFTEIKGPLKSFQATKLEKDDIFRLLKSINNVQEKPLTDEKLKNSFEAFWPQFESEIEKLKDYSPKSKKGEKKSSATVNVDETVDEILQLLRNQNSIISDPTRILPVDYLEYAFQRSGVSEHHTEHIFEELYAFSRYIFNEFEVSDPEFHWYSDFLENYMMMIKRVTSKNMSWSRRFSSLFRRYRRNISIDKSNPEETFDNE